MLYHQHVKLCRDLGLNVAVFITEIKDICSLNNCFLTCQYIFASLSEGSHK